MRELVPDTDPTQGLGDFFDLLWREQDGYVYLPNRDPKNPDPKEAWQKVMFSWPDERPRVIKYVLATTAQGRDVYFAPAIFSEKRPIRENVKGTYFCWVDFDGNAPESWPSTVPVEGPSSPAEALNALEGAPTPTLRIMSSRKGHEHVYWAFDTFQTDQQFIENTNRALAYKYKADTSGWDLGQVLRPPYTTNYKHDLPVTIEASIERAYTPEHFAAFKRVKQLVSESIKLKEIPKVERVIAKYKWDDHHFELFMKDEIEEGKRSSALMALGFFGAENGMTDEEIYSLLINADDRWGKFKHRSDREKRLLDIINRARQKHPVGSDSAEGALRGLLSSAEDVEQSPEIVYGFRDFNNLEVQIEWIIEGLLERMGMCLVSSAPGVGKTQFSLQFGISCALGKDFLIWPITRPFRILWFSLEMHAPALQYFTKQMAEAYTPEEMALLNENLFIVPMGEVLPLDHPEGKKFIEALIEEYKPDGIILDSMGKVTHESLADERKAKELNSYYASLRKKFDLFIWFIHHNRKAGDNNKKPKELSDIYGNQYLQADLSSAISLWPENGKIEVNLVKQRLAKEAKPVLVERNEYLHFVTGAEPVNDIVNSPLARGVFEDDSSSNGKGKGTTANGFTI